LVTITALEKSVVLVTKLPLFVFVSVFVLSNANDAAYMATEDVCWCTESNDREADWHKTELEREHNWYNVSGLIHGRTYRIRVAAVDRHGDMMKSEFVEVVVGIHPGIVFSYTLLGRAAACPADV